MAWSLAITLLCFAVGVVAQQGIEHDPAPITRHPLSVRPIATVSPAAVVHSYSTPATATTPSFSKFAPSSTDPLPFMPPAAHIPSHPTWSTPSMARPVSTAARSKTPSTNVGAIVGGIIGGLVLVVSAVAAVFCFRSRKNKRRNKWQRIARGSWHDAEGKGAPLAAAPGRPFEETQGLARQNEDNYTQYVPRPEGRKYDLPKITPSYDRILQHHSSGSSDPFADPQPEPPRHAARSNSGADNIEMKINPSSPGRVPYPFDMKAYP
ncbi:hypothetical protein LshimejAT787_0401670 [Lyophyllum shimeji]|uniref:Uncharacterized protein n=1 Tax=Lyophyllum shimeji TaxID=47721 RepID=A0A9P3PJY5_LYOSH|nr:hypothetical protein LshimejAT787_0401670 [Lyophyllum shimeji]